MSLHHIALVSETPHLKFGQLARIAAALQKQVLRDFAGPWDIRATVDAFASLNDVPIASWPVIVKDDIGYAGAAGIHLDADGAPFGLVQMNDDVGLICSHEALEMLADPVGNRFESAPSISDPDATAEYLVEVCDPSEDADFAYKIDGILVSDFYLPSYFNGSGPYSHTRAVSRPREVLRGGYVSYRGPHSGIWYQETWIGSSHPQPRHAEAPQPPLRHAPRGHPPRGRALREPGHQPAAAAHGAPRRQAGRRR